MNEEIPLRSSEHLAYIRFAIQRYRQDLAHYFPGETERSGRAVPEDEALLAGSEASPYNPREYEDSESDSSIYSSDASSDDDEKDASPPSSPVVRLTRNILSEVPEAKLSKAKLPKALPKPYTKRTRRHLIGDSIEG